MTELCRQADKSDTKSAANYNLAKLEEFPDGWGMVGFNDGHLDGR